MNSITVSSTLGKSQASPISGPGYRKERMIRNAIAYLTQAVKIKRGERVFIITDNIPRNMEIGAIFCHALARLSVSYFVQSFQHPAAIGPNPLSQFGRAKPHVVIEICRSFPGIIKDHHIRRIEMAHVTKEMLFWKINYDLIQQRAEKIMAALEGTDKVLLTSAKGTNLELCIKGRPINTDIKADASGLFSNFPPGEVYIAPQESQTQGRLVLDGAIGLFGDGGYPLRMDVIDGRAQIDSMHFDNLPGNKQFYYDSIRHFFTDCPNGNIVAELGIGAADYPVRGNISSDEKIFGSVHLGFGNNHFLGGEIHSATHIDAMIYAPTIVLVKPDGSRLLLMENGQLRI